MTSDKNAYRRARDARLRAEREADPVKMAEWQREQKEKRDQRNARIAADPERAAVEKARLKRIQDTWYERTMSDPVKLAAFREKNRLKDERRRRRLAAEKPPADPKPPKVTKQEEPAPKVAKPVAVIPVVDKPPVTPKPPKVPTPPKPKKVKRPYQRKPAPPRVFDPFSMSSPDILDPHLPAAPKKFYPPLPPRQPFQEAPLPAIPERESWKPNDRLQAMIDASLAKEAETIDLRKLKADPPPMPEPEPEPKPKRTRVSKKPARTPEEIKAAARAKYEEQRQAKIDAGTYRPPGNPALCEEERALRLQASYEKRHEKRRRKKEETGLSGRPGRPLNDQPELPVHPAIQAMLDASKANEIMTIDLRRRPRTK